MKRLRQWFLCGIVLISIVFYADPACAGPGFFDPASSTPAIREAASAVYRYVILSEQAVHTYSSVEYAFVLEKFSKADFVHRLSAQAVLTCQSQQLKTCDIPYAGSGTAFITGGNHDQLVTVSHNLDWDKKSYRQLLASPQGESRNIWLGRDEEALMRNMPLHFALFDSLGRCVFDTRLKGDFASPEVMGYGQMVNWIKGFHQETPVDFTLIRLSRPVGDHSLELSDNLAIAGETLSVIGYPGTTNTRQTFEQAPDSDGLHEYVSRGEVYSIPNVLQFNFGPAYVADPARDAQIGESVLYVDTESVMGFSGAPVLDQRGKVAGLLAEQWGMSDARFYTMKSAIVLHSPWLKRNFIKYAP